MKTFAITFLVCISTLFFSSKAFCSNEDSTLMPKKANLSGKIIDRNTGESLVGAMITVKGTQIKVYSDLEGNFNITNIEPGNYSLEINYISYTRTEIQNIGLNAGNNSRLKIDLIPN
jgi:hypothetical protein